MYITLNMYNVIIKYIFWSYPIIGPWDKLIL